MRITPDILEGLLRDAAELFGVKKKNDAVRIALHDFVQCRRRERLLGVRPKSHLPPDRHSRGH